MSEPLTAAGAALLRFWCLHRSMMHGVPLDAEDAIVDDIRAIEAEAAARAVDEALSVERVAEALHAVRYPNDPETCSACLTTAAALVAHLRGPRPEGEG